MKRDVTVWVALFVVVVAGSLRLGLSGPDESSVAWRILSWAGLAASMRIVVLWWQTLIHGVQRSRPENRVAVVLGHVLLGPLMAYGYYIATRLDAKRGAFRLFPEDADGDLLRRMQDLGFDLSKPQPIEFRVVMPNDDAANALARSVVGHDHVDRPERVEVRTGDEGDSQLFVVQPMMPTYSNIKRFKEGLAQRASSQDGSIVSWRPVVRPA